MNENYINKEWDDCPYIYMSWNKNLALKMGWIWPNPLKKNKYGLGPNLIRQTYTEDGQTATCYVNDTWYVNVTAPSGCISLAPQFSLFSTLVVKTFLFLGCEHVSNAMALTYSRSTLLSLRFWWKNPTQLIKPLRHSEWTACKLAGILKPTRGTHGGIQRKIQADHRVNRIPQLSQDKISSILAV